MYQTTVQKPEAVRVGSAKIEVSEDGNSWVNLGVGSKGKFQEKFTPTEITADNGGVINIVAKDQNATLSFSSLEPDLTTFNTIRGNFDGYSVVGGTPVSITGESHGTGWTQGDPIGLINKNGDNSQVASITVKNAGTALTLNTDYRVYVGDGNNGALGVTYIVPLTAQAGAITVDYTYTPNAAKVLKSGGNIQITSNFVRATNTNPAGKKFQITLYKAYNSDGISIDFPADDDPKAWEVPLTFKGVKDPTRTVGDQLFNIYDEQSIQ